METRWARVLRGWLTAGISVLVAALSHVAGGGAIPGQLGVVLALTFAGVTCVLLAGKTLSRFRLAVSVGLSQVAFHLLFGLGANTAGATVVDTGAGHHHGAPVLELAGGAAASPMPMLADPAMWLAHVVAALVTIIVLRHGESAFWMLVELARTALVAVALPRLVPCESAPVAPARVPSALADRLGLRDLAVIVTCRPHRGPPSRVAPSF